MPSPSSQAALPPGTPSTSPGFKPNNPPLEDELSLWLYIWLWLTCPGVPASHIFQARDKPYYHDGFKILFIMAAMAIGLMVVMRFAYQYLNRRIEEGKGTLEGGEVDRGFRYQL